MCDASQVLRPETEAGTLPETETLTGMEMETETGAGGTVAARAKGRTRRRANGVATVAGAARGRQQARQLQRIHYGCCGYCHMGARVACSLESSAHEETFG